MSVVVPFHQRAAVRSPRSTISRKSSGFTSKRAPTMLEAQGLSRRGGARAGVTAVRPSSAVLRESSRDVKLMTWLESLGRDFRLGFRLLRKDAVVSPAAIVSLGLAIGACTAAFSLIDALILRELPVRDPQASRLSQPQRCRKGERSALFVDLQLSILRSRPRDVLAAHGGLQHEPTVAAAGRAA